MRTGRRLACRLPVRQVGGFAALQLFAAIAPLTVLPIVTRILGVNGWIALSVGLSVGAVTAIVITFGWAVRGPGLVAAHDRDLAAAVYRRSMMLRLALAVPALAVAAALAASISESPHRPVAALMAVATGLQGLTSGWFFVGVGRPASAALADVLPRVAFALVAVPVLQFTREPLFYPLLLACGTLTACLATHGVVVRGTTRDGATLRHLLDDARRQAPVVASGVVLAGYGALAVPVMAVTTSSAAAVAAFAAAVRLRAMTQVGVGAVSSGFQGWALARPHATDGGRRRRAALLANTVVGAVVGGLFASAAPAATTLVFGPGVTLPRAAAVFGGGAILAYAMSASLTNHLLAPAGMLRWISVSTTAAALCAVPLLLVLGPLVGASGAMAAVMTAEVVVVAVQAVPAYALLRRPPRRRSTHVATASR